MKTSVEMQDASSNQTNQHEIIFVKRLPNSCYCCKGLMQCLNSIDIAYLRISRGDNIYTRFLNFVMAWIKHHLTAWLNESYKMMVNLFACYCLQKYFKLAITAMNTMFEPPKFTLLSSQAQNSLTNQIRSRGKSKPISDSICNSSSGTKISSDYDFHIMLL